MFPKRHIAALMTLTIVTTTTFVSATEVKFNKWVEEIKFSGDLRLRYENFHRTSPGKFDRTRQRFRLRLNSDFILPYNLAVKLTLASGTGEQVSTNQSFDNLSNQKSIWIDKIYASWSPAFFKIQGGRMENPFWRQYSSDVVWDGDFNPEGFSQSFETLVGPFNVFGTALQMVVDEDSSPNDTVTNKQKDQWMLGEQVGVELKLPLESRFRVAYANYNWINEKFGNFSQSTSAGATAGIGQDGNRRVNNASTQTLTNDFYVNEWTGALSSWIGKIPVTGQITYIRNDHARKDLAPRSNKGRQYGVIVGKAKEAKTFELAYFYKAVEADATIADVADSDFGEGGTNRKGHIIWVSYAPTDWMLLSVKNFHTRIIDTTITSANDSSRTQVDWSVKF